VSRRKQLESILNSIKSDLNLDCKDCFDLSKYVISKRYDGVFSEYKDGKIKINSDLIDSYGKKLEVYIRYDDEDKEIKKIKTGILNDYNYFKNVIIHEISHKLDMESEVINDISKSYGHNITWASFMIMLNGEFPDLIIKFDDDEIEDSYDKNKDLNIRINKMTDYNETEFIENIIFLYESNSEEFNHLVHKIKRRKNKENPVILVTKDKKIKLIYKNKEYLITPDIDINKRKVSINYHRLD